MTHNVYRGRMAYWTGFYEKLFNFREIRYFDIKGEYTGLTSKAMTAPDGLIRIPLNEEASKSTGQIEEFLMQFNGEGIQHIALFRRRLRRRQLQGAVRIDRARPGAARGAAGGLSSDAARAPRSVDVVQSGAAMRLRRRLSPRPRTHHA
jgi:Glyoxalase/Bleomycin resistance protein/Dioxygenase superfamily